MIKSFRSKSLKELFETGKSSKVAPDLQNRAKRRLDTLEQAIDLLEINLPGFNFHPLKGFDPVRYTIHVSGAWCITFEFEDGHIYAVDLEQYH
jgi:proteic killer suppression protein